jgi:hypothetical protein
LNGAIAITHEIERHLFSFDANNGISKRLRHRKTPLTTCKGPRRARMAPSALVTTVTLASATALGNQFADRQGLTLSEVPDK